MAQTCVCCQEWTSDPDARHPWRCPEHRAVHGRAARRLRNREKRRRRKARERAAKT